MIVDTSAVVVVVADEPDADRYLDVLRRRGHRMSAASFVESGIVLDRRGSVSSRRLDALMEATEIEIVAVTEAQARLARQAYRDFGKGSGHPARLNFGDCFSYALAVDVDEPLLFKGDDFVHTDVRSALDHRGP